MKKSIEEIKADYHLFIDIQMGKYLSSSKKTEFTSEEEAKLIMNKIVETYNQKIASNQLHLDNLNEAAKTSWFNSVEIDFSAPGGSVSGKVVAPVSSGDSKNIIGINKATIDFLSFYDHMFPFLPEGAVMYLMYAGPALEAYGYPIKRFK